MPRAKFIIITISRISTTESKLTSPTPNALTGEIWYTDIFSDLEIISESLELGLDVGSRYVLKDYTNKRLIDKKLLIQATHRLNQLFSNNSIVIKAIRENGLKIFNKSSFLKKQSMMFAMGLMKFDF